jgi:hypothetical protein
VKDINHLSALKIDEVDSVETLVPMYQISLRYIQEDTSLRNPDLTTLMSMVMENFIKC